MTGNQLSSLAAEPAPPGPVWLHLLLLAFALGVLIHSLAGGR
ncbi:MULTISPECIES: hypothetical protein [Streptomyces]|jgi:hypothetical protein|nr:hypothetical protein [Streptomyces sp. WAC05292]